MAAGEALREMDRAVRSHGRRLEHRGDFQAIVVQGKPVNHVLHLFLTIFTLDFWAINWLCIALAGGEKRVALQVDEAGRFRTKPL